MAKKATVNKPTADDIERAIFMAETRDWIDPSKQPIFWYRNPEGRWFWNGCGDTPAEAMALAWLHYWAPDALIRGRVSPDSVPLDIPDGFEFRLTPPWKNQPDVY